MKIKSLFLALSLLVLTACNPAKTQSSESIPTSSGVSGVIEITDMVGRKVSVDTSKVNRVVCIGAGALRLYSYVGEISSLSGVEDIDNPNSIFMWQQVSRPYYLANKEAFAKLPSCGVGGPRNQSAESEKILSCRPDIVISEYEDVAAEDELQNTLGVPVVTVKYGPKTVFDDNIKNSIKMLGQIFKKEERAKALTDAITNAEKELKEKTQDITEEDKPSVYAGCVGNWGQTNIYGTAANYAPFQIAGIKNAVDGETAAPGQQTITKEKFQTLDIDKIILDASGMANFAAEYKEEGNAALFDNLPAVLNGEVYLQMPYNAYYTNIETALINTYFAASVTYPSRFENFNIEEKADEIHTLFNGKALYSEIKSLSGSYGGYQRIENLSDWMASKFGA